jgi:hypothetical protein
MPSTQPQEAGGAVQSHVVKSVSDAHISPPHPPVVHCVSFEHDPYVRAQAPV